MQKHSHDSPLLHAYAFDGEGGILPPEQQDIAQILEGGHTGWVHLRTDHPHTRAWLKREVQSLDKLILNALLAETTRPRLSIHADGALLILRGVNLNPNAEPEDMVSIRLWVDATRIVSLRRRRLKAVGDVEERLLQHKGPRNTGEFIATLCASMFERMEPVLADLDERTDDIEEQVIEEPNAELRRDIIDIRKQAIILRRYIAPQREVLAGLRSSGLSWLSEEDKRHLQESLDRITRYIEDLDSIRERAQIVKDELSNALADRLNRNMYLLSVIAAIFLPLGFLTGLLGTNIGGLPGVENPHAFWIFSIVLAFLVAGQIWLFKKLRWF